MYHMCRLVQDGFSSFGEADLALEAQNSHLKNQIEIVPMEIAQAQRVLLLRVTELLCTVVGSSPTSKDTYARSLLAVLLQESHRTSACQSCGYRSMRAYALEYGMIPTTYSKYLVAGSVLLRVDSPTYFSVVQCVHTDAPDSEYPQLPPLDRLYSAHGTLVRRGAEAARRMLDKTYATSITTSSLKNSENELIRSVRTLGSAVQSAEHHLGKLGHDRCPEHLRLQVATDLRRLASLLERGSLDS